MIADIAITEKSFGPKVLMTGVKFSIDAKEKVGAVGRNGIGKSTLFGMLAGTDTDYTGDIVYRKGITVVATAQEHHVGPDVTVMEYILAGVPEYSDLKAQLTSLPLTMGDDMKKIEQYTAALDRFGQKGFYQIEEMVAEELKNFQLEGVEDRPLASLSGGQKRLIEVVKIMHSDADLALIDEPTNHMDYVAKQQFIDWMKNAREAMLVITHDRDVLKEVDRIVELKDGVAVSYRGNYDQYLKQNASMTGNAMTEYELTERRIANLKEKVLQFRRLKEKARDPDTIKQFKRRELQAAAELTELEKIEKPTFWIDKDSVAQLDYKHADRYEKFKAKNIHLTVRDGAMRSQRKLVEARDLALGYGDEPLFECVNIDLREGEAVELRGRNGAGKTTVIRALLGPMSATGGTDTHASISERSPLASSRVASNSHVASLDAGPASKSATSFASQVLSKAGAAPLAVTRLSQPGGRMKNLKLFDGSLTLDPQVRVGIYEQEVSPEYFSLPLRQAIERVYLDRNLKINDTKVRQLMSDYLFTASDGDVAVERLSGGQKARLQIIAMLANDPQLLILDEPTNHLDLPSIEELEMALEKYSGAILYVSHDNYFRQKLGGQVVRIGTQ